MYAKLFTSMYSGTLRGNSHGILVFTNLLAHCDASGIADIHPRAIAEETGLTVKQVRAAIAELASPDPESRSPDEEGRRITLLDDHRDWGWIVVNFAKYRAIRNADDRRAQSREAMRRMRAKKDGEPPLAGVSHVSHGEPKQKQRQKQETTSAQEDASPVDNPGKATPKGASGGKPRRQTREEWIRTKAAALKMTAKAGEKWETFAKRVAEA